MNTRNIKSLNVLRSLLLISVSLIIVNCGGSGGKQSTGGQTPTPPPTVTPELVTLDNLSPGTCVDIVEEPNGVEYMSVKGCTVAHQYEVAGSYDLEGFGDEYPGSIAINRRVHKDCRPLFANHTGGEYTGQGLGIETITPSINTWNNGDRNVICLIVNADRSALTKSVAQ